MKTILKTGVLSLLFALLLSLGLEPIPAAAQSGNVSLYLAPASGTYVIGGTFNVAVRVNTGGASVNVAEGNISFDSAKLEVTGVSRNGSIFSLWVAEPAFNNSAGSVSFSGGIPGSGYSGTAGQIVTVSFRAKQAGDTAVSFSSGAVLANDGKGTNILTGMVSGNFKITPRSEAAAPSPATGAQTPTPAPESDYNLPKIESSSHPDPNKWYNQNSAKFTWELPEGVTAVSFSLNEQPIFDPGNSSDGLITEQDFGDLADGIHYFHVKFQDSRRWGTIAHYRVMIDTEPPLPFEIRVDVREKGQWPVLMFETEDKRSGLLKYEVFIGSLEKQAHELEADQTQLETSGLSMGEHTAIVKAVDQAGNERIATVFFSIDPIDAPSIISYPANVRSGDKFYLGGRSGADTVVSIYIRSESGQIASSTASVDAAGNWFYLHGQELDNGRYVAWAEAVNARGIRSEPSQSISFLVSPPVFAMIGNFVINYFTVIVSLIFLIVLIIALMLYIFSALRKRLKKEAWEVEDVLKNNLEQLKQDVEAEFERLRKYEGKAAYKKEKAQALSALVDRIDLMEKQILKEVKDVEEILE